MGSVWRTRIGYAMGGMVLGATIAAAAEQVSRIDTTEAASLIASGVTVIDVRRADEWRSTGVVPGSHLITAYDADGRLVPGFVEQVQAEVKPGQPVVLICRTGVRSVKAAQLLTGDGGYDHVYSVDGGVTGWTGAGRPLQPCANC